MTNSSGANALGDVNATSDGRFCGQMTVSGQPAPLSNANTIAVVTTSLSAPSEHHQLTLRRCCGDTLFLLATILLGAQSHLFQRRQQPQPQRISAARPRVLRPLAALQPVSDL